MLRTVASNRLRRATRHILGVDPGGRLAIGESSAGRGRSASDPAERFSRATAPAASAGARVLRGRRLASEQDSRPCRNRWLTDFVGLACCDAAAGASHSSRAAHDGSRRRVRAAVFVRAARLEVSAIPKQPDVGPACDKRRGGGTTRARVRTRTESAERGSAGGRRAPHCGDTGRCRLRACPPRQFRPIKREPSGALLRRHLPIGTVEAARWRLVNVAGPGGSRYEGNGPSASVRTVPGVRRKRVRGCHFPQGCPRTVTWLCGFAWKRHAWGRLDRRAPRVLRRRPLGSRSAHRE